MGMKINGIALTLLFGCLTVSAAQASLEHLKSWEDKYPRDFYAKPKVNFFKLPEIQLVLTKLLSKDDYRRLTQEFGVQKPIKLSGDYLEVRVCKSHCCPCEHGALIVNLKTGVIHVGINSYPDNEDRWFSTKGSHKDLPTGIRHTSF